MNKDFNYNFEEAEEGITIAITKDGERHEFTGWINDATLMFVERQHEKTGTVNAETKQMNINLTDFKIKLFDNVFKKELPQINELFKGSKNEVAKKDYFKVSMFPAIDQTLQEFRANREG